MQFVILILPFVMTVFIIIFEWVFPPQNFRFSRLLGIFWPLATLAVEIALVWQPGALSNDGSFNFSALSRVFLSLLFGMAGLGLLAAYATDFLGSGRFSPVTLAICGTIVDSLYLSNVFLVTLSFVAAGFFSIVAVVDVDPNDEERFVKVIRAAVRYLIASVFFGLMLFISLIFLERFRLNPELTSLTQIVVALAIVGFATRLAIFPLNLWLPEIIEEAPGLAGFLVLGLINVAVVVFLMNFLLQNPLLLVDNEHESQLVMALGLSGAALSALLALGQNGLGKLLAYTASADLGLVLFGLATNYSTGQVGAMFEAATFAFFQLLIFTCLSLVYYCNSGRRFGELSGLGRRMPVAALGLCIGFLGLAGVPLLGGFAGKYLIMQAAARQNILWALIAGATVVLLLIAQLRYFHRVFMGRDIPGLKTLPEPRPAILLILAMVLLVIVVGLWPAPLLDLLSAALKGNL
jgi:formate hydrogenlyase subunit 3/multisubunit Na+/H+ antiporter MnhD subunit